jgi:uncharacterized pyridoxamine 5'-phosphate oxidase family protein
MSFKEYTEFALANPACFLATVDGNQPRVRGFLVLYANEKGFFFTIGRAKDVYRQLQENPKLELCFFNPQSGRQMRVAGKVEWIEDLDFRAKVLEDRPWIKDMGTTGKPDDPVFAVLHIPHGDAHFWEMSDNLREKEIKHIFF